MMHIAPSGVAGKKRRRWTALGSLAHQERGRRRRRIERRKDSFVNGQGQIKTDEIRVFDRPHVRQTNAECSADHEVDGLGIADAVGDERDRLPPERRTQAASDEQRVASQSCSELAECARRRRPFSEATRYAGGKFRGAPFTITGLPRQEPHPGLRAQLTACHLLPKQARRRKVAN